MLIDWFGSRLDDRLLEQMQAAGIELQRHNPPRWNTLTRINHRTHRRLLVVDGRTGFIGGAGMGDKWQGDAEDPDHWRDSHFQVEGPVVAQLQSAFIGNWAKATGEVLCGPRCLPELQPAGNARAHVFAASPFDSRSFSINDEANLNVFDAEFAARQIEVFENDLKRAERITLATWRARSWSERLLGSAAALFTSQL